MGNGIRHLLGVIAGIIAIPVVFYLITMGMASGNHDSRSDWYLAGGMLAVAALLLAWFVEPRTSPLASLITGLPLLALGAGGIVQPDLTGRVLNTILPSTLHLNVAGAGMPLGAQAHEVASTGVYLLIGVLLVFASIPPSRWRSRRRAAPAGSHAAPGGARPSSAPIPADPAWQRATPPLPGGAPGTGHSYPYGEPGAEQPYGRQPAPASDDAWWPAPDAGRQQPYDRPPGPDQVPPTTPYAPGRARGPFEDTGAQPAVPDAAGPDESTNRIPWSNADRQALRNPPDPY